MTLGYCPCHDCDKLVPIVPRELKNNNSVPPQRNWYPIEHDRPNGTRCNGHKIPI